MNDTKTTTQLIYAARDSIAWEAAWRGLRDALVSEGIGDGSSINQANEWGEGWQYMGGRATDSGHVHEFRHRDHPVTRAREYRSVRTPALSLVAAVCEVVG